MKAFIFLYPIPEIINHQIEEDSFFQKEEINSFRCRYKEKLNECIDLRYRQKGFNINYAIFDGCKISDIIKLQPTDNIISVGLSFKAYTTKLEKDGEYLYPNQDFILNQLGDINIIRISGFHLDDCVDRLAKRAYERGLDTLVDEDLTDLFSYRLKDSDFQVDKYPSINPRKYGDSYFEMFMELRKNSPWLWQKY